MTTSLELDSRLRDRDEQCSDRLARRDLTSENSLSTTTKSTYSKPYKALTETALSNESDSFERHEILKDALHYHGKIPEEEVLYCRSVKDEGLGQDQCLENKYSRGFDEIGKAGVSRENKTKTNATQNTSIVIPKESAVKLLTRDTKVITPQIVHRELIPKRSDEHMGPLNESPNSAKEKEEFSHSGKYFIICILELFYRLA